ncbi:MAG: helix-turn-helix transcriptional regulator [Nitrospinae bacterium]|nr:helix-turn-helix transcriptional regulator [Nitrospinota bacterium]
MLTRREPAPNNDISCPVHSAIAIIQGKWTLMILRDLMVGTRRFGELRQSLAGVSPKTLSVRLKELEETGVLTRTVYAEVPPRVEYALTEKGRELEALIAAMGIWGTKWKGDNDIRRAASAAAAAAEQTPAQRNNIVSNSFID